MRINIMISFLRIESVQPQQRNPIPGTIQTRPFIPKLSITNSKPAAFLETVFRPVFLPYSKTAVCGHFTQYYFRQLLLCRRRELERFLFSRPAPQKQELPHALHKENTASSKQDLPERPQKDRRNAQILLLSELYPNTYAYSCLKGRRTRQWLPYTVKSDMPLSALSKRRLYFHLWSRPGMVILK